MSVNQLTALSSPLWYRLMWGLESGASTPWGLGFVLRALLVGSQCLLGAYAHWR